MVDFDVRLQRFHTLEKLVTNVTFNFRHFTVFSPYVQFEFVFLTEHLATVLASNCFGVRRHMILPRRFRRTHFATYLAFGRNVSTGMVSLYMLQVGVFC